MTATDITASDHYFRQGVSRVLWVPTIANLQAPTRSELNAGTDLSNEIAAVAGWEVTGNTEDTPALGSVFVGKVPSTTTSDNSSLTLYADRTSDDVRGLLSRGSTGYVVWMDEGDVANYLMDVFPSRVTAVSPQRDIAITGQIMVSFAIMREPAQALSIPS